MLSKKEIIKAFCLPVNSKIKIIDATKVVDEKSFCFFNLQTVDSYLIDLLKDFEKTLGDCAYNEREYIILKISFLTDTIMVGITQKIKHTKSLFDKYLNSYEHAVKAATENKDMISNEELEKHNISEIINLIIDKKDYVRLKEIIHELRNEYAHLYPNNSSQYAFLSIGPHSVLAASCLTREKKFRAYYEFRNIYKKDDIFSSYLKDCDDLIKLYIKRCCEVLQIDKDELFKLGA